MNSLKIKDLVTIGVFAVLYFVVMFAVGMIGVIPILFLCYPTILGIFSGVLVLFFMMKEQKPFALLIFGMISPLGMFFFGHTFYMPLLAFVSVALAELIRRILGYHSVKGNMISFAVFNTWICASLMQMLLAKEKYMEMCQMMGDEYAEKLEKLISAPTMLLVYVGAFVGGIIGAFIARAMLKKHFQKAGLI